MASDEQDREQFEAVLELIDRVSSFSGDDRLFVLELAWMAVASHARSDALAFPGGFSAEQAKQLDHLEKIARLVREEEPDIEVERAIQEADTPGLLAHLRRLRKPS